MKKRIFALATGVSLLACACLGGCSTEKSGVTFYVWGDNTEVSWYEQVAAAFTAETGIEVKVTPSTGSYYDNLNISLGNKRNAPDIFFTEQGEFTSMLASGRIANLKPYIESGVLDVKTAANPDGAIELWDLNDDYRFDGETVGKGDYHALIKDWSPDFMMWYNKSHIDEYNAENGLSEGDDGYMVYPSEAVPMTWSAFADMSYKLTKRKNGMIERYGTILERVPYKHLMEFIQMSGETTFKDGIHFNSEAEGVKKAFEFFGELQKGEKASSSVIGPTGIGSGEAFFNGSVSIVWFGSWAYSSYNWDSASFEFGIAPPPIPDKENVTESDAYAVSAGMIALAVNDASPVKDDAVKFLNYYMTKGAEFFAGKGFNIPGNKKVAQSDTYLDPEDIRLSDINRYFYNFAESGYVHSLVFNRSISQVVVESIFDKSVSVWLKNYNVDNLPGVLAQIATDIRNEIG